MYMVYRQYLYLYLYIILCGQHSQWPMANPVRDGRQQICSFEVALYTYMLNIDTLFSFFLLLFLPSIFLSISIFIFLSIFRLENYAKLLCGSQYYDSVLLSVCMQAATKTTSTWKTKHKVIYINSSWSFQSIQSYARLIRFKLLKIKKEKETHAHTQKHVGIGKVVELKGDSIERPEFELIFYRLQQFYWLLSFSISVYLFLFLYPFTGFYSIYLCVRVYLSIFLQFILFYFFHWISLSNYMCHWQIQPTLFNFLPGQSI